MITDNESIQILRKSFEKVNGEPGVQAEMSRKEDVAVTLFYPLEKNMPERLYKYRVWSNSDDSATLISDNEKEGYETLDKEDAEKLKSTFLF
ncbi:hypothetical protein [Halalkalibacter alkalisediminis]|uniref:Uncharacterized protein n=1 Tax=Halalkalibacter alkalisediminis TaxID=935616 RepID=A0ABV6NJ34_9BACI|nr:hypothetical protein [Halalkalibacter alkalisediminis]